MGSVVYTPRFKKDLDELWDFIGQDAPDRADAVLDTVETAIETLAQHPMLGRSRDELMPGLRSFPTAARYLIYYRPLDDGIALFRLLHTSRDVEGMF